VASYNSQAIRSNRTKTIKYTNNDVMLAGVADDNGIIDTFPKTAITEGKKVVPTSVQGYIALDADPVDMAASLGLVWTEKIVGDTIESVAGPNIATQSIFVGQFNYRIGAGGVTVINTTNKVDEEWEGTDEGRSFDELQPEMNRSAPRPTKLALWISATLSIAWDWFLKIEFEVSVRQQQWKDDPEDWSGYEDLEVDYYQGGDGDY